MCDIVVFGFNSDQTTVEYYNLLRFLGLYKHPNIFDIQYIIYSIYNLIVSILD